jgi:hypothetical protein
LTLTFIVKVTIDFAKISWHYIFNVKINNPKEYISKWSLQGLLSLLRTQKTDAGGYFFFAPTHDTVPLKQGNFNKKSDYRRIIALSGLLRCTILLFHNWSSFTKIISSFPSLQDVKTVLYNAFNWFGRLFHKLMILRQ